ncbi:MAG TPA: hypothetical protein VEV45_05165 [Streptosporangiaceae bacterium]|nr:hypothetical protein [Streptosporangiaceae bacterium]
MPMRSKLTSRGGAAGLAFTACGSGSGHAGGARPSHATAFSRLSVGARTAVAATLMFAALLATGGRAAGASAAGRHATARVASRAAAGRSCRPTVTRLPDLGHGGGAVAFSGGTIVGEVSDARGNQHPAIWRRGRLHVIRTRVIRNGGANDINARGQIVGLADNFTKSWELYRGRITILRDVPGSHADYARRINNRGQIAGAADNMNRAARWDSATAAPVLLLPQADDKFSFSKGINDRGQVAGDTDEADGTPHAAVWGPAGHIRVLSGAYGPGSPGDLFEINDAGTSAGESFLVSAAGAILANQATIWARRGAPAGLGFLPGLNQSTALGLSGTGFVSGESSQFDYAHGIQGATHAFVWPGHGPLLALPVPHMSYARSGSGAHQISGNGTVVGAAGPVHDVSKWHAYVWTCVFQQAFLPHPPAAQQSGAAARNHSPWRFRSPRRLARLLLRRATA